ncbi:MAG: polyprenyl synthetase family protein [Firmicutes bacterium]|nr:polyprenyl synthetase family protein [Bacillota bacterium]
MPVLSKVSLEALSQLLEKAQNFLLPELQELELFLQESSDCEGLTAALVSHLLLNKGKRIRPLLVLLTASLQGKRPQKNVLRIAGAVELIHTASLVHDDIIDESDRRRGRPSLNCLYGNHLAVLAGDYLFAKAFYYLADDPVLLQLMTRVIGLMCQGEVEQGSTLYCCDLNREDYWARVYKKTAFFLGACCRAGGYLAGLSAREEQLLEDYGVELGKAYQLVDDLLDFTGDPVVTGKPVASDLLQGIVTLPVIELMQNKRWKNFLQEHLQNGILTSEKVMLLRHALEKEGIINALYEEARQRVEKACGLLQSLPSFPAREHLTSLAQYIVLRQK